MDGRLIVKLAKRRDSRAIALMSRSLIERGFSWRWTPERIAGQIAHPDSCVIVAWEKGRRAGFAAMSFGVRFAHLNLLAVRADCRRRGVGSALLEWLEESARTAGVLAIKLEVRARNRSALDFYRSHSYEEIACLPGYYQGREDAIRMLGILHLPVNGMQGLWRPARVSYDGE